MEHLEVFDCSNILIACYFNDDRGCAHENREHTLIYLCSGELEIEERGKKTVLHPGECAFMRRDNRMWLHKKVENGKPYRSIVLKFSRPFLRDFYRLLDNRLIPGDAKRDKTSLRVLPSDRPDIRSLFESVIPYFEAGEKPSEDMLKLKMTEGIRIAPHRPEPLCVPVRLRGTVEDRHPRLPERKLHARPLHERNRKLHGAQPGHFQTGLCQGQRPDSTKVDYQTPSGSRPRLDTIRKEKSDGSLFRCGIQKPVALL